MGTRLVIILMWVISISYLSCEEKSNGYGKDEGCNCGIVCEDGVDAASNCQWLLVENECSGSLMKFCVDKSIWSVYHEGDRICINEQSAW